jgi:hypothetical protein
MLRFVHTIKQAHATGDGGGMMFNPMMAHRAQ